MNLQVLPLKVLVTREVVKRKMDYSTYLNGTAKEELDKLDKLAGNYRIEDIRLTIDGGKEVPSNDWQDLKKKVPEILINLVERKDDFSIVEKMNNGMRTWILKGANGTGKDLMSNIGRWEERSDLWIQRESFIKDGAIVNMTKVSKMYKGERILCLTSYHSFAIDQQGNFIRRLICGKPDLGYKVTKEMKVVKIDLDKNYAARNYCDLDDNRGSEEGDVYINATLAALRQAVRNGLLNNAFKEDY